jgi:hypothetical protein
LYPDLVFWFGIGRYFLGIFHTDTEGKLGKALGILHLAGTPFFPQREASAPFFDGSSPPYERKISSRQIYKMEFLPNFTKLYAVLPTKYTDRLVPVTYRYRPNCQYRLVWAKPKTIATSAILDLKNFLS